MKDKLPVNIENNILPVDKVYKKNSNYGYVSIMYLLSLMITIGSLISLIIMGR